MSTGLMIIIGLISLVILYLFINYRRIKNLPDVANNPKIKVLTDKNFQHQIKNGIMLVDFWASWCMPCKMMSPVLNDVAEALNGTGNIGKLDVEQYQSVAAKFNVRNIPTMILFRNGKEIDRYVGAKSRDFLLHEINKIK